MPRLVMDELEQIFRKIEISGTLKISNNWHQQKKQPVFSWNGSYTTRTHRKHDELVSNSHGVFQREGTRYAVHRFLFFNLWDDRDQFDYTSYKDEMADAKRWAKEFLREHSKSWQGAPFQLLWRTRWNHNIQASFNRSIWVCAHQRELLCVLPRFLPEPRFTLGMHAMGPMCAVFQNTARENDKPMIKLQYKIRAGRRSRHAWTTRAGVVWERSTPLIHEDIVGADRALMLSMYAQGMTGTEVMHELPKHPDYQDIQVSHDWKRNRMKIMKELYT